MKPSSPNSALIEESCALAARLLASAERHRSRHDATTRRRFARLLDDSDALFVTMSLADEVIRTPSAREAARILRRVASRATVRGLGVLDAVGLRLLAAASLVSPSLTAGVVRARVRSRADGIILPAESAALSRHIRRRRADDARLNVNVLGEAVLGDAEAAARLASVIEMAGRPDVDYVSVKISSVVAQIVTVDRTGSLARIAETLRPLYRVAAERGTFVNLDMEEYRDLELTLAAFMQMLDEPEFESLTAGIVLQAYLPEAHDALARLLAWAKLRHARTGGSIKIRLVKGANLAMEATEAELHGWIAAPYESKALVDASYVRMLDTVLRPEHAASVRIGVASHNIFHLAHALVLARSRGVAAQLDIEMLEGMANAEALALAQETGSVILYTPVTRHHDFSSAVAYLVRRLDENTSPENYLRASFAIREGNDAWHSQRARFLASVRDAETLSTQSRRHARARHEADAGADAAWRAGEFRNEPDGDPTRSDELPFGLEPALHAVPVASRAEVDAHVETARRAQGEWWTRGAAARAEILRAAAARFAADRRTTIALMMHEAGKNFAEADPEVSEAVDFARFYALAALRSCDGSAAPLGVVAVVPPWNFPYAIPAGGVCAALAAGNSVILKPAPETVQVARHLAEQLWVAGVPRDVLHFVRTNDDEVGRRLVTHEAVAAVVLTGGFATAELFLRWKPEMRLMAETSGKNAIIVTASADVDAAVKDIVQSAFGHAGQKCSAASLAIVDATVLDDSAFLRQLRDAVQSLRVGPGDDPASSVGPLIRAPGDALTRALTRLDDGESWLVEPLQISDDGRMYRPGVRIGVQPGSWAHMTEWFGPVLAVMRAHDLSTAIAWQNAVDFGLTAGVHALNAADIEQWLREVRAGNLYVNRGTTGAIVGRQPFGGWRKSSVGSTTKAGGAHYVESLLEWPAVASDRDVLAMMSSARRWWEAVGSVATEVAGLRAERNYVRYVPCASVLVVVDYGVPSSVRTAVESLARLAGIVVSWMDAQDTAQHGQQRSLEHELRSSRIERVRWLASSAPPPETVALLLSRGVTLDRRTIAVRGDVELPRWLKEQSVSITNHRHGNVGAGPRVRVPNSLSV
jgi:RHH-type proline utilization regulon transcriptional repressor/proline dehydrogenase/delta 1-pyrroline-5-carboxylate dehydrogenase